MSVNPPESPRSLFDRTTAILTLLRLPTDDQALRRRVETFILCNGFHGVHRMATQVARHRDKNPGTVQDPWAYTVRVYNGNLARLSYLYTLTHWVENGLRSQVDTHFMRVLGATWHRDPLQYFTERQANSFQQEYARQFTWQERPQGPHKWIEQPETPAEFLEHISLAWLNQMVLNIHKKNARSILMVQDKPVDYLRVEALLKQAVTIRNAVAHNHFISNEVFGRGEEALLALLGVLQFDVLKALENAELERAALVRHALRRLGAPLNA